MMKKIAISTFCAAAVAGVFGTANLLAQTTRGAASATPADFSGVYYPVQQGRGGGAAPAPAGGQRAGAPTGQRATPPPPTRSAPYRRFVERSRSQRSVTHA